MPLRLTLDDRRIVIATALVALLLVAVTAILSHRPSTSAIPTTYSSGSSGTKALYLLLESSHYAVGRWERPLADLPPGDDTTLILAEPNQNPTDADRRALARFIDEGGRVIATGYSGALFLPIRGVDTDPIDGLTWTRIPAAAPSLAGRAAPEITMSPGAHWDGDVLAVPLYSKGGAARAIEYTSGRGEVIWWASSTPATNAGVREPGNLEFDLACLGDAHRRVLWDEYVHGYRDTVSASLIASPIKWAGAQLAVLAGTVLLTYSRRSGPIIAAPAEDRRSPLEFVRTLSALYQRAGAASIAVEIAYQQFRHRMTRRLGIASTASIDELERAVHDRRHLDDRAFGQLLRDCESARRDARLPGKAALTLTRALWEYSRTLDLARASAKEPV
jgi:hypothetical protein